MRNVPDVSLNANPNTGYAIYNGGHWVIYGGTSCASPLWAAFTALVNQKRVLGGSALLGFPNPTLYTIGKGSSYTTNFHDIADGSTNRFYPAVTGFDDATGWGSYNGANLITSLVGTTGGGGNGTTPTQLLLNPGFENGSANPAPWSVTAGVVNNSPSEPAHSGAWKARLCGYGTTHTDSIAQTVTIPSTATKATLTFYLHIDTADTSTTAHDTLKVQLLSTTGAVVRTLGTYSNLNHNTGYALRSYDLTPYIGRTLQVYLVGTEDASLQTSFVVDDFALNVQ
jgi:kumamolisin